LGRHRAAETQIGPTDTWFVVQTVSYLYIVSIGQPGAAANDPKFALKGADGIDFG
jgi:hypothetical protein